MENNTSPPDSTATIGEEARAAGATALDIRERVREITLKAIEQKTLSATELREVLGAVMEGIQLGLAERGGDVASSLREAVAGMDQALVKFAQSLQLAVEEAVANGREYREGELKQSLETVRDLEKNLIEAIKQAMGKTGDVLKAEMGTILDHLKTSGTDVGGQAFETLTQLAGRVHGAAHSGKISAELAARDFAGRVALFASGLLAGLGEALRNKAK